MNDFMKMFPEVKFFDETNELGFVNKLDHVHRWYSQENNKIYQEMFWSDSKDKKNKFILFSEKSKIANVADYYLNHSTEIQGIVFTRKLSGLEGIDK